MVTKHIFVSGRVQGVRFRYHTKLKADELGVHGWVRNLKDGRVEVLARAESTLMSTFIVWLNKGPELARVDHVDARESHEVVQNSFQILRD